MDDTPELPHERGSMLSRCVKMQGDGPRTSVRPGAQDRHVSASLPAYTTHSAAILVVILAVIIARTDWLARMAAPVAAPPEERTRYFSVSARGGARVASEDLHVESAVLRTAFGERSTPTPTESALDEDSLEPIFILDPPPSPTLASDAVTRTTIITYIVQAGDIVGSIAQKFNISEDTVCWANGIEDNPDLLRIGQVLTIPPVSGVLHVVEKGDTLEGIAKKYKATVEDIVAFEGNGLGGTQVLVEGQQLIVPGGKKPYVPRVVVAWQGQIPKGAKKGSGKFVWPTSGVLTQKYTERHQGLDIAWQAGTPVIAADSGFVAQVGSSPEGYGRFVLIDHGNGFQTLYAHLKLYYVQEGQSVAKGEKIGLMGDTGRSTGPHLHFEIRKGSIRLNPLNYLPPKS